MRELAERLRELRLAKDLTVESVAQSLLVSASKISRLETAQRRASARDVRDLCLLYGVSNDERDRLMALAAQALETSWYQDADIDSVYGTFIGLEEAATHIENSQNAVVPGLLQTPDYARALLSGLRPEGQMSSPRIDELIAVRSRRQQVLDRESPPALHVVIDETALLRPIAPPGVMAGQIRRLLDAGKLPNIVVQVIDMSAGSHPGLDGRFSVLRFAQEGLRDTVYIEGLLGELFLDKESDVDRYRSIFRFLAESVALSETATHEKLEALHDHWMSL